MPLPKGCLAWEYDKHPRRAALLPARAAKLLASIQAGALPPEAIAEDPRSTHRDLFIGLTPPKFSFYAGNMRGEYHRCLIGYTVHVAADLAVGYQPAMVPSAMRTFGQRCKAYITSVENELAKYGAILLPRYRAAIAARLASHIFVRFLTIHPFANGNGHVARAFVWSVFFRFGYAPDQWTIEPRPTLPDWVYGWLITEHRNGRVAPLEKFFLECISVASAT